MELDVTHLAVGGAGIARAPDGRVVLCEGALPGERVSARVVLERRDFLLARAVSVLRASPARTVPACPYVAEGCGGCTFAYVDPGPTELALKAAIVADALRRIARLPDPAVVAAPAERGPPVVIDGPAQCRPGPPPRNARRRRHHGGIGKAGDAA